MGTGVKRTSGAMLTAHPHLVRRSRMSRSYTSSPPWRLFGVAGQLYFLYYYYYYYYCIIIIIIITIIVDFTNVRDLIGAGLAQAV
jgi:hypothetical protein